MKTLTAAALLAALALTALTRAGEPVKAPDAAPAKAAAGPKKLTVEGLGAMLTAMGYEAKPAKDKGGRVYGYEIAMNYSGLTVYCSLEVSTNGQVVWLYGTLARTADAGTPAPVLLAMLDKNFALSPASIHYSPDTKKFGVLLTLPNDGIAPARLRAALDQFARGIKVALDTYDKEVAKLKEQGEKSAAKP